MYTQFHLTLGTYVYGIIICSLHLTGINIRLVGGSSYIEGRVEVYYNGEWGTVCDDGWDDTDAGVVCRQLGFGSGTFIGSAGFGRGSGSIWLDSVKCNGSESILASCGHLGVGITIKCYHSKDAGVKCSGDGKGCYLLLCNNRKLLSLLYLPKAIVLYNNQNEL